MDSQIHEKLVDSLEEYEQSIKELALRAIELSHRTSPEQVAERLYKELDKYVIKGEIDENPKD